MRFGILAGILIMVSFGAIAQGIANAQRRADFMRRSDTSDFVPKVSPTAFTEQIFRSRASTLTLDRDGYYTQTSRSCGGNESVKRNWWRMDGDILKLDNSRLVVVQWNPRTYLIRESGIETDLFFMLLSEMQSIDKSYYSSYPRYAGPDRAATVQEVLSDPILPDRYLKAWQEAKESLSEELKEISLKVKHH